VRATIHRRLETLERAQAPTGVTLLFISWQNAEADLPSRQSAQIGDREIRQLDHESEEEFLNHVSLEARKDALRGGTKLVFLNTGVPRS